MQGDDGFLHQVRGDLGEGFGGKRQVHLLAALQHGVDLGFRLGGQQFLGFARLHHQQARVLVGQGRELFLLGDPAQQAMVEVVAAQGRIAAGGQHFEHALGQLQDGDIEGAAAEVVHGIHALRIMVEAVGDRRRGRLVQQAQHVDAGQLGRILGGLALGVVEVRRHRDHRADQLVAQGVFGLLAQGGEDFRRHFDRALHAGHGLQLHHAGRVEKIVGQVFGVGDIFQAAAHEALDRDDGVLRVAHLGGHGLVADVGMAVGQVAHHRGQQRPALFVGQHFGNAAANRRDQRIGGAQVDAHRQPVLVRRGGHARFGDLQKRHKLFIPIR